LRLAVERGVGGLLLDVSWLLLLGVGVLLGSGLLLRVDDGGLSLGLDVLDYDYLLADCIVDVRGANCHPEEGDHRSHDVAAHEDAVEVEDPHEVDVPAGPIQINASEVGVKVAVQPVLAALYREEHVAHVDVLGAERDGIGDDGNRHKEPGDCAERFAVLHGMANHSIGLHLQTVPDGDAPEVSPAHAGLGEWEEELPEDREENVSTGAAMHALRPPHVIWSLELSDGQRVVQPCDVEEGETHEVAEGRPPIVIVPVSASNAVRIDSEKGDAKAEEERGWAELGHCLVSRSEADEDKLDACCYAQHSGVCVDRVVVAAFPLVPCGLSVHLLTGQ